MRGILVAGVMSSMVLAGCGSGGDRPAATSSTTTTTTSRLESITEWKQGLDPILDRLSDAFRWVGGAALNEDLRDTRAGCRELDDAVDDLESLLPSPQPSANAEFKGAVESLRQYASDCQSINPRWTKADFAELQRHQDEGMAHLEKAVGNLTGQR